VRQKLHPYADTEQGAGVCKGPVPQATFEAARAQPLRAETETANARKHDVRAAKKVLVLANATSAGTDVSERVFDRLDVARVVVDDTHLTGTAGIGHEPLCLALLRARQRAMTSSASTRVIAPSLL